MALFMFESIAKDKSGERLGTIYGFLDEKDSAKLPRDVAHGGSTLAIDPWVFAEKIDAETTLPRWLTVPKNRVGDISAMLRDQGWAISWGSNLIGPGRS